MQVFIPMQPPYDADGRVVNIIKHINDYLSQISAAFGKIQRGQQPVSGNIDIPGGVTDHGALTGLVPVGTDENDDHTQYLNIRGRTGGQTVFGDPKLTNAGIDVGLIFRSFNGDPTSVASGPAQLSLLDGNGKISCPGSFSIVTSSTDTKGLVFNSGGANFVNAALTGTLTITPTGSTEKFLLLETATVDATYGANKDDVIFRRLTARVTGNFVLFESSNSIGGARVTLSSIRKSDGAWVGPIVGGSTSTIDSLFKIVDDIDPTKILMFQLSGITTGTTRTLTIPNLDGTILVAAAGATNTIDAANGSSIFSFTTNLNTLTGAATGSVTLMNVAVSGIAAYSSGTPVIRGLVFNPSWSASANYTPTAIIGVYTDPSMGTTVGTITAWYNALFRNRRSASNGPVVNDIVGVGSSPSNMTNTNVIAGTPTAIPTMRAFLALRSTLASAVTYGGGTVIDAVAYDVDSTFAAAGAFQNWSGLRIPSISGPGTIWGLNITGTMDNRVAGKLSLGMATAPAHWLDIAAGTATVAQMRTALSTLLTVPVAGAWEYDGAFGYLTHADAVRTKIVTQRGQIDLTGQVAAIGATAIYTPPAAGYYVVHYTIADTAADIAAGTIQFQVNYTDDIGATNQVGGALAMTAVGRDRGSFQVYSASGAITYQTNLVGIIGTAAYALRVRITALG